MRYIKLNENEKELNKKFNCLDYTNTIMLLLNSSALISIIYFCITFNKTASNLETLNVDEINNVVNLFSNTTVLYKYIYNFGKIIDFACSEVPAINCSIDYY